MRTRHAEMAYNLVSLASFLLVTLPCSAEKFHNLHYFIPMLQVGVHVDCISKAGLHISSNIWMQARVTRRFAGGWWWSFCSNSSWLASAGTTRNNRCLLKHRVRQQYNRLHVLAQ